MKKLPLCTLLGGALFAIIGTFVLLQYAHRREPLLLGIPLGWDLVMVGIGSGVVLRCDCARRAGLAWGVFCIVASLLLGGAAFEWVLPQQGDFVEPHRMIFLVLSVAFGVIFGVWQLIAFNGPAVRAWTAPEEKHHPSRAQHG